MEREFAFDDEQDFELDDEDFEDADTDELDAQAPTLMPDPLEHPF
jgi:hypothetical protein